MEFIKVNKRLDLSDTVNFMFSHYESNNNPNVK